MAGPLHSNFVTDILSKPEFAAEFFSIALNQEFVDLLDLGTISTEEKSYIDKDLKEYRTDLLFNLKLKSGEDRNIYILFEHKSHPDRSIVRQLLRYLFLIHADQEELKPVIPVVFYHGKEKWTIPEELQSFFGLTEPEKAALGDHFLNFRYFLVDVGALDLEGIRASFAQRAFLDLLIRIWDFEDLGRVEEYFQRFGEFFRGSELEFFEKLLVYIFRVQDIEPETLRRIIKDIISEDRGDFAMTTAERLEQRGMEKGILQGKLEDAKNFLNNGVSLEVVLKSTSLTEEQLREAKIIQ